MRSQLFKDWILGCQKPTPEQLGPGVIRQLDKEPHLFVPLSFSVIRYLDMQPCDKSLKGHSHWTTRFLSVSHVGRREIGQICTELDFEITVNYSYND